MADKTVVRVWKEYAGNQCGEPIPVGIYQPGANELHGLERYLVDNGNAVVEEVFDPNIDRAIAVDKIVASMKTENEVTEKPKRARAKRGK